MYIISLIVFLLFGIHLWITNGVFVGILLIIIWTILLYCFINLIIYHYNGYLYPN